MLPMILRHPSRALLLVVLVAAPARGQGAYQSKTQDNVPPPKEVTEAVRKQIAERCVQFCDAKGEVLAELWFRKELPAKATDAQIKNGLTYREVPETTLLGVIRLVKQGSDYRKQKLPPGVYTLRLGAQPMDGDHMGTAPFSDFALLTPAADDKGAATLEAKALHEASAKTTSAHPAVLLLFPGTGAGEPKVVGKADNHWVLLYKQDVDAGGKKTSIGIGLCLVGHSPQAE
jgi:hypothetical protein